MSGVQDEDRCMNTNSGDTGGADAQAPALEARNVQLAWGDELIASDISLHVEQGEIVCLVGRSGCGKTTLFHALAGLTVPPAGEILLHGENITGQAGHVSYMLQKDLLLPSRTIIDNVCLPLLVQGMSKREAHCRAKPLFEQFGLAGTEQAWPSQLSGGMRQRAALLRTYLMNNDVILLDEPFSALDALTRTDMRGWFCGIVKDLGLSALVVTHDVEEAVSMAQRIYVMRGNPTAGEPSKLVGEIAVPRPSQDSERFDLTVEYLTCKRQTLDLLG